MTITPIKLEVIKLPIIKLSLGGSSPAVAPPLTEEAAEGNSELDTQQRGAVIGEPIPIVFCRRVSGVGGVLISPPATEARFEDDVSSNITASYHLVLSEGQIDSIQVRDVFQRSCRVGSFSQTYGRRAGTFIPGNFIDNTPNLEAPNYCGTGGTYSGLSTMAFSVTIPAGFDYWDRQVHCFVRGGLYVPRLLDSVTGASNNVADLLLYLLRNSSRVPESIIDTATSFLAAATFTNVNGFFFNGVISESTNVRDWMAATLQYFLLRQARIGGKEGLRPQVPINANGTIKTTAVTWVFTFTEKHIIPDSFDIIYTPLSDRKPFCVTVLWRQQDDLGIPVMRTSEVRYTGTAEDGPFEQHDMSGFCSSENHAVKVGTYILSRRKHITHQLQIGVKPDAYNSTLAAGDLVRVRLERTPSTGAASVHDYLYEVDRIGKSIAGEVRLELTHFPVDDTFASVVAKEVNAAVGAGVVLPTGLSGVTCDVNSSGNTSVPADTSLDPGDWNLPADGSFNTNVEEINETELDDMPESSIEAYELGVGRYGQGGGAANYNPADGKGNQNTASGAEVVLGSTGDISSPAVGDTASANSETICAGGTTNWYRQSPAGTPVPLDPNDNGGILIFQNSNTYTFVIDDVDYAVWAEVRCPDPTSPTGYGEPTRSNSTGIVVNRYYTPDNPLTIPASSGTLSVSYSGVRIQTTECSPPFTKSSSNPSSGGPLTYSASNVVQIWMGANAGGISIGCGASIPTNILWDGSLYYKTSSNSVTKISLYGGNYGTDGNFGITSALIGNGKITFEFVTSVGGVIGPVYVGETAPPPVPIVP